MGVLSSSPGFVPGSNGPAVQGDWHREWKTAVWEETQNYKSECVEITAEGPVSTHLIVLHLTEDLNLFLAFDWIIMCFKTCEFFPSDIVPLLPLPPFFTSSSSLRSTVILTSFCNMLTCQASKVEHWAVHWSRGERGLISSLSSSSFWPFRCSKPAPSPLLHNAFLTFTTLAVSASTCTGFQDLYQVQILY